jgi:hypothetical protein
MPRYNDEESSCYSSSSSIQKEPSSNINRIVFGDTKPRLKNENMNNNIFALYNDCMGFQKPKNTHKYNTWELTMEHEGLPGPIVKKNIFVEALNKIKAPNEIVNPKNTKERLEFKHHMHFISITINGKKKFFDLFEIYKTSKSIDIAKKKSFFKPFRFCRFNK